MSDGEVLMYSKKNEQEKNICRLRDGNHFGEFTFVTGLKSPLSVKSEKPTSLFVLSYIDFLSIIKENPKDYVQNQTIFLYITFFYKERFCMLKDKIMLTGEISHLKTNCYVCNSQSHLFEECKTIRFIPNKDFKIRKNNYSIPLLERITFTRTKTKRKFILLKKSLLKNEETENFGEESEETGSLEQEELGKYDKIEKYAKPDKLEIVEKGCHKERKSCSNFSPLLREKEEKEENKMVQIEELFLKGFDRAELYQKYFPDFNINKIIDKMMVILKGQEKKLNEGSIEIS